MFLDDPIKPSYFWRLSIFPTIFMNKILNYQFLLILLITVFASCSDVLDDTVADDDSGDPAPTSKSSAKSITSFKFSELTPEVVGTITGADNIISVIVLENTKLAELVPTIEVSEKANISPSSDLKQDFSNPVTYTVTAEDGTKERYVVTVTTVSVVNPKPTIISLSNTTGGYPVIRPIKVALWSSIYITGTNFSESGNVVNLVRDGVMYPMEILSESSTEIEFAVIRNGGEYTVMVTNTNGDSAETTEKIIAMEFPEVLSINKTTFEKGETIVVQCIHLKSSTNPGVFYFSPANGSPFTCGVTVNSEHTEMSYTIPESFTAGSYVFYVQVDGGPSMRFNIHVVE